MGREYPEYCNAYTIGESVLGNKLWVLTVSKEASHFSSPDYTPSSLSPSFLYIGNMHGDEPLGRQLMVYLAEELCSQAGKGKDLVVDRIVESGSVHLLFSMNPDGFDLFRRGNAHKVDLNRNFPDPILQKGEMNLTGEEEPETLLLMNYVERLGDSLVGSSLLHEGALVVNYPFDGAASGVWEIVPNPSPDDELFRYLAKRYVEQQPELQSNPEFPEGIVQGSSWYPLYGGLQDWLYLKHNVYTTIVEMNDEKWPAESELEGLWRQHKRSMYAFLVAYVCEGLTVEVDFAPGSPEEEVTVTMLNQQMGRPVKFKSSTLHGVHYPVPEGQYSVRVDWESGESATHSVNVSLSTVFSGSRDVLRVEKLFQAENAVDFQSLENNNILGDMAVAEMEVVEIEEESLQGITLPRPVLDPVEIATPEKGAAADGGYRTTTVVVTGEGPLDEEDLRQAYNVAVGVKNFYSSGVQMQVMESSINVFVLSLLAAVLVGFVYTLWRRSNDKKKLRSKGEANERRRASPSQSLTRIRNRNQIIV
jgi:carboxypeptidase D